MARYASWVLAVARLLVHWNLTPADWYLSDASVIRFQGYPVPPLPEAAPHCLVHVNPQKLPFQAADTAPIAPPGGAKERAGYERLLHEDAVPLELVSWNRHAIPITFRKMIEVDGQPVWVASLRGLARIWLGELTMALRRERGAAPADVARVDASAVWLWVLAEVDWPPRDRWFGKLCAELAPLVGALGDEGAPHAARFTRLGRKYALF